MGFLDNLGDILGGGPTDAQQLALIEYNDAQDVKRHQDQVRNVRGVREDTYNRMTSAIETGEMPTYFTDKFIKPGDAQVEFDEWKKDYEWRIKGGAGRNAITAQDIYMFGGRDEAERKSTLGDYLNYSGFATAHLGAGKRFDAESSEIGINPLSGELSITDPMVRTTDPDTGDTWTARYTQSGEREGDLAEKNMLEGETSEIPFSTLNSLDSEYYGKLADRANVDPTLEYMGGARQLPTTRQELHDQEQGAYEARRGALTEEQAALEARLGPETAGATDPIRGGTTLTSTGGSNIFGANRQVNMPSISDTEQPWPEATPDEINQVLRGDMTELIGLGAIKERGPTHQFSSTLAEKIEEFNQMANSLRTWPAPTAKLEHGSISASHERVRGVVEFLENNPQYRDYRREPGNDNAWNLTDEQWGQTGASPKEVEEFRAMDEALQNFSYSWAMHESSRRVAVSLKEAEEGFINDADGNRIDPETVTNFYASSDNKFKKGTKLYEALMSKPHLYDEYMNDPFVFAAKYAKDTNALYGPPLGAVRRSVTSIAEVPGVDGAEVERAIVNKDREAIEAQIASLEGRISEEDENHIANMATASGGDFGRAGPRDRALIGLAFAASAPEGSDIRNALINSNALPTFFETGQWGLAGATLQDSMNRTNLAGNRLAFDSQKWRQTQADSAQEYSAPSIAYSTEMNNLLFDEEGRVKTNADELEGFARLHNTEGNRIFYRYTQRDGLVGTHAGADFLQWSGDLMTILKASVRKETEPAWWQEVLTLTLARGEPPNLLNIAPKVSLQDASGNPVTDPTKAGDVRYMYSTGDTSQRISLGAIKGKFGLRAIQALLAIQVGNQQNVDMSALSDLATLERT